MRRVWCSIGWLDNLSLLFPPVHQIRVVLALHERFDLVVIAVDVDQLLLREVFGQKQGPDRDAGGNHEGEGDGDALHGLDEVQQDEEEELDRGELVHLGRGHVLRVDAPRVLRRLHE